MSVHLQADAHVHRITVLGRPLSEASCDDLLVLLARADKSAPAAMELVFYDADALPASLLEAICAALDAGHTLKVLAYHGLLAQRLGRLGVPVRQALRPKPRESESDANLADRRALPLPAQLSIAAAMASGEQDLPSAELMPLFLDALHAHCGQDLRSYQPDSLMRRIRTLMSQLGLPRFSDFQRALFSESQVFERFTAELPVGVTSFFRHPEQMRELREQVLPYLQSFAVVKLWCAGCSSGEEAYSLASMLDEAGLAARSHLFATDMNPHALTMARDGLYPLAALQDGERDYQASGGSKTLAHYLEPRGRIARIARPLNEQVLFYRHSLSDEGVFNEFQLIVCRNVLIYFSPELQEQVLQRFMQSLHPDGLLALGPHDGMGMVARDCGFVPVRAGSHVYRIKGGLG